MRSYKVIFNSSQLIYPQRQLRGNSEALPCVFLSPPAFVATTVLPVLHKILHFLYGIIFEAGYQKQFMKQSPYHFGFTSQENEISVTELPVQGAIPLTEFPLLGKPLQLRFSNKPF